MRPAPRGRLRCCERLSSQSAALQLFTEGLSLRVSDAFFVPPCGSYVDIHHDFTLQ